jgi:peptidoglycan/xylan/chitin deacetylase (PgdA/CDA1 family)
MRGMIVSRRALLGLGALAAVTVVEGCTRAVRRTASTAAADTTPGPTPGPTTRPAATSTPSRTAASAASGRPAVEIAHAHTGRPEVALTFHGAGDPGIAREILAIAADHGAKITVMAVGAWLAQQPQMAADVLHGGHDLGNHTYNHLDIDALDEATAKSEIVRCRDVLHTLVGTGGTLFRPSQSQHATSLVLRLAGAAGYPTNLSYDVDSLDYTDPGAAAVRANVAHATAGSIVSMHFGHAGTVAALPAILADLKGRGLRAVTATELLAA